MNSWYQESAKRTLSASFDKVTPLEVQLLYLCTGACGELGEVSDLIKKMVIHKHGVSPDKLAEEIGDVMWYIACLCETLGLNMDDVMINNIDKLKKRYPNGFDTEKSINRKD